MYKEEINGVSLIAVRDNHPSPKMRALAQYAMYHSSEINSTRKYALEVLGMSEEEFRQHPWSYEFVALRYRLKYGKQDSNSEGLRGGKLISGDRTEQERRVLETTNRIRADMGVPLL